MRPALFFALLPLVGALLLGAPASPLAAQAQHERPPVDSGPHTPHPEALKAIDRLKSPFCPGFMLEVCPSIASARPRAEIHPLGIGGREDPVRLVFDAAPGPGVVIGMADLGDRFRLVANAIEVTAPDEPLPRLPVARAVWKPAPSLATSAESWLTAGGPHHTVLTQAVGAEPLRDFATMLHTELLLIDENTTAHDFADRVRWNQAYYRQYAR